MSEPNESTERLVVVKVRTDASGKCDDGCDLRYKTTWYDWCPFELDRNACRAAEVEVDKLRWMAEECLKFRDSYPITAVRLFEEILKLPTAAGRVKDNGN